ncbi:hypothetical protein E3N88_09001 [Mikania micrantha]|uniref:CCHC-type domain-containing protein n=1 Tax=Mikania micrantha TaxID=192012 RepID=A0A5N6PKY1_9ASTR|nr:hypothetical protein E3N88_09001 [Mikania micrantha]
MSPPPVMPATRDNPRGRGRTRATTRKTTGLPSRRHLLPGEGTSNAAQLHGLPDVMRHQLQANFVPRDEFHTWSNTFRLEFDHWAAKTQEFHEGKQKRKRFESKKSEAGTSRDSKQVRNYDALTTEKKAYGRPLPQCAKCKFHHVTTLPCRDCTYCKRLGHTVEYCNQRKHAGVATANHTPRACYECGGTDHIKPRCPKLTQGNNGNPARGRAFALGADEARVDPNVVTGTYLLNNHYVSVLFDTGADKSFVSKEFESMLGQKTKRLDHPYSIELANGKKIKAVNIIQECTLAIGEHILKLDMIPIELGSFDVIVGMDWLSANQAEIVCHEKLKYLGKNYCAFLANVVEKKGKEKKLQDIPIVRDYPEVFPEDLPGLPPKRQVEFRIDLVSGAAPVAKSPYRLAPSEMQELSSQLQELLDK